MSCVQLSEGCLQVVYPLGLWSRSSGSGKVPHAHDWYMFTFTSTSTFTGSAAATHTQPGRYRCTTTPSPQHINTSYMDIASKLFTFLHLHRRRGLSIVPESLAHPE